MTESQIREVVRKEVERIGSIRAAAKKWRISHGHLADFLRGERKPYPAVIGPLGYVRETVTTYRKKR